MLALLPTPVIVVYGQQVLHILLGDLELDALDNPGYSADRNSQFLTGPKGAPLEEHVGDAVALRTDDEPLDPPRACSRAWGTSSPRAKG